MLIIKGTELLASEIITAKPKQVNKQHKKR